MQWSRRKAFDRLDDLPSRLAIISNGNLAGFTGIDGLTGKPQPVHGAQTIYI